MLKTRGVSWSLTLVLLASCRFSPLPRLTDGGSAGGDDAGTDGGQPALPISLELLAGDIGSTGNLDGTGSAARFNTPSGIAIDGAGNLYVADQKNNVIRKVTPLGVATTVVGTAGVAGSADGTGPAAQFQLPSCVAVDGAGNLYVADTQNETIRKVTAGGVVTTLAGMAGAFGSADGTGAAARFDNPAGLAVDATGNVFVVDQQNSTIRKVTPAGVVTTLAGAAGVTGSADGTGSAARFNFPFGIAIDGAGNLYVGDASNATVRKVTPAGVVTTVAGTAGSTGSTDGTGAAARFFGPTGVAVDGAGNLYVADFTNSNVRKIAAGGVVTTVAGDANMTGVEDGRGTAAHFNHPLSLAATSSGTLYVTDGGNGTIRKINVGNVTTLAGTPTLFGSVDATGAAARFITPRGVAVDSAGAVYVADRDNQTIRKVTPAGVVTTLAGTPGLSGSADGTGPAARFERPIGAAVDGAGSIYVGDSQNATIRKVATAGSVGVVTTLAGTPHFTGSMDGTGAAARFSDPNGVAIDAAGNVYVADRSNVTIRKVTAGGVVTTLAGQAGRMGSDDGTGPAARFFEPEVVAVDGAGNVYVADLRAIRKITAAGDVTTLAGASTMSGYVDGTGIAARFGNLAGIATDGAGNVYVADQGNSLIRKITPDGVTTTVAGAKGVLGIVLGATPRFATLGGLAISGDSLIVSSANAVLLLRHGAQ